MEQHIDETLNALFLKACRAREKAYAPYSSYRVGAALLGSDGETYAGANIENVSFGLTICAEASAIVAMASNGCRVIEALCVVADGTPLVTPCGACRQRIREFATADLPLLFASPDGQKKRLLLGELLPHAFGPSHLEKTEPRS